jgi:hypothetical protein
MSLIGTPLGKWLRPAVNCNRLDVKEIFCEDMYCLELVGVSLIVVGFEVADFDSG